MNITQYYQTNDKREIPFTHPGIIFKQILKDKKISQKKIAADADISLSLIKEICQGKKNISQPVAQKLATYFKVHKDF